jgi:hypothetical protein
MVRMRAKFKLQSIEKYEGSEALHFSAVCPDKFGENGENEDNDFAR